MKRRLDSLVVTLEPVDFTVNVPNPNVPIPQALSDEDKWMYLIHQAEIQTLLSLESEYEYHWRDHVHPVTASAQLRRSRYGYTMWGAKSTE